ncbi:hypothetical protein [Ralstonia wenshanensis]|uniref:hypothetical protein n=1 Tax=Ralstonia wenshanensis TaxID=2842456 RepID=UPI001E5CAD0C|nr:hypothetical protein [Ralstonia wenshanensis]
MTTFATTRAGQNARYTFNATAGQNLTLAWTGATFAGYPSNLSVVDPSGNTVANSPYVSSTYSPNGEFQLTNLQKSGTYTVFMDPNQANIGQVGLQLLAPASGTLTVDGPSLSISQQAGATGRYSFAGTAGQTLGLGLDALVTTPSGGYASVAVVAPDKVTTLANCGNFTAPGNSCNLTLPSSGTYTVVVTPSSANTALTGNLTLSNDAAATLVPNAPVTTFATTRAGQNARYTFSATAGQNLSLAWSGATFAGPSSNLSVVDPQGNTVASAWYIGSANQPSGVFQLTNLQKSGTYTVFMDPYQATTGQIGLQLLAPASGTLTVDGPSLAINQVAGATGRYSFAGTAGQTLGLGLDTLVTTPSGGYASVAVVAPDKVTTLANCGNFTAPGNSCNLTLPSDGTYTVVVTPSSASTALTGNLTLSNDAAATLVPNAPVTTFATTRAGQNARYTFSATAGQNLSLAWSGATFAGPSSNLSVVDPQGNTVASAWYIGSANQPSGVFQLTNLQKSGTYTVFMDPYQATTGQIGLQLLAPASGTLTVDGPSLAINQVAGATGRYSFAGTAGQTLGLGLDTLVTTPSGGYASVAVVAPDKVTTLANCGNFTAPGNSCNLTLPSDGTYTVVVTPSSASTALTGNLTLSNDAAATLVPNAPVTTFATTRAGQNARYTFSATAGQNLSLAWSGATFAGPSSNLSVVDPQGNTVASAWYIGSANQPSGVFQLTNLQKSGTYTVFMDPYQATTGQIGLQLLAPASGTLTVDGPSLAINQVAGATGRYSFAGTAGQTLGLGLDTLVTTPSGGYASVAVVAPDKVTTLANCGNFTAPGNSCNLTLPSDGTYTVVVTPSSASTALTGNLTLSNDAAATLVPNAPVTTFATTRAGQNARYTFSATAGQNLSLAWGGSTFASYYSNLSVVDPSGNTVASASNIGRDGQPNGEFQLTNLQKSGTYTVFMDPYQATTGQIGLQLLAPASGTLTVDGPSLAINQVAGATGRYSFAGTAGQTLGLGLDTLVTTPSGGYASVAVVAPDKVTTLANCGNFTAPGNSCNLTLPSDGTYTVVVTPSSASTALTGNLTLSSDIRDTLSTVTFFSTNRVGQNGRYTFIANAGDNISISAKPPFVPGSDGNSGSGGTISQGGVMPARTTLTIYGPAGNPLASWNVYASTSATVYPLNNLQQSGTFTLFVDPYQTNTGTLDLGVWKTGTTTPPDTSYNGAVSIDGPSLAISQQAGATGRYSFTGTAGQTLGLGLDTLVTTPSGGYASVRVMAPDNVTTLVSCYDVGSAGNSCNLPALPSSGTYTVVVTPGSANTALTGNLTLSNDAAGTLTPNAPVTTFATSRVGQNGRYTFNATAGQNLSLAWTGATFPDSYSTLTVYDPSGNAVANTGSLGRGQPNGVFQLTNLQKSGTYTVFVDLYLATTGQVGLQLLAPASGTLTVDGPSLAISQQAGATGRYSFTGTAGQTLGLGLDTLVTTPSGGYASVRVMAPDNVTTLVSCYDVGSAGNSCNLPALPSSGTYTVVVTPGSANTALTGNLTLSNDAAGTLTPNAPVTTFATSRVGQNGRYTFNATAGQNLSLAWTGATFPDSYSTLTVYDPSGNAVANTGSLGRGQPNGVFQLTNLQKSGTYTVFVDLYLATTGQVGLQLLAPASGTLTVDGPSLAISQQAGATGRYSFTGTAGQTLGLGLDTLVTTPSGGYASVRVMAPDNVTTLVSCSDVGSAGNSCNLPALPSSGTYTVVVTPGSVNTALTGNLTLSNDAAATLTPNAPVTTFATTRAGQNARYTFNATAGQNLSLAWTGATFPGSYGSLSVVDPSGNTVASTPYASGGYQPNGVFQLTNLQKSGTYTVFMDPYQATTGQIGLQLLAPASGTLTVDGPSLAISQQAGATGRYSFTGTAGQTLGLGLDTLVTTPSGGYASVRVMAPDNVTTLVSCSDVGSAGNSCNLPALPSSGTYTVVVTPGSVNTALTGNLTLSNDAAATLTPNAPVTTFATTRAGQNARYTFNATAGQNLSLAWTGATFPGSYGSLSVVDPSGNTVASTPYASGGYQPNGVFQLTNLQKSGTYTVFMDPYQATTGQIGLQLLAPASGTLTVDGPSLAISQQAGATGRYSFTGTAGQTLGLGLDTLVTTPSGGYASVRVMAPDNVTTLVSCSDVGSAGNSCNLPALPSSGTYTVVVTPGSVNTALTGNLTLSNDAAATLTPNAPVTTFATTRAGQNARYTFNATAGQNLSLAWTGATFPGSYGSLSVVDPSGNTVASTPYASGGYQPNGVFQLTNLQKSGTYTVFMDPYQATTGQIGLQLLAPASGTLTVDGPSLAINQVAGAPGRYTFTGTAGQFLNLGFSGAAITPTGSTVTITVIAPDNVTTVVNCGSFSTSGSCSVPALSSTGTNNVGLPSTGTYTVVVTPNSYATAVSGSLSLKQFSLRP